MLMLDVVTERVDDNAGQIADFLGTTEGLSDHLRLDLEQASDSGSAAFVAVIARRAHGIVGYGQLSAANHGHVLEIVGDDDLRPTLLHSSAAALQHHFPSSELTWWADDPAPALIELAEELGLRPHRTLYEMRRPLPHPERATIQTRGFRDGDEAEWVMVNNRAFADHGEQGGWTVDTLRLRQREPWFDRDGFRIYERDGAIVGFCWTKIHDADNGEERIGEIYVIAVDPSAHGRGLGTQLTLAGLDSLSDRNIATANLYVDASNQSAVRLYERLGFSVHRTRHAFAGVPNVDTPGQVS